MKVFLAGTRARIYFDEIFEVPYVLESFAYFDERQKKQFKTAKMFLLDSGAFTFLNNLKDGKVDFDAYLEQYIAFINEYGIQHFFELDIDPIVGYDKVKEYRRILERKTGKRCIPVWHKSRGLDDFRATAKEYDYMAIGGIVTREIKRSEYGVFTPLLNIAHGNGCKVHGLGFTNTELLHKYKFDSVDSTNWVSGSRFATAYKFNGRKMLAIRHKDKRRIDDYNTLDRHNIREWIKFQKYADCYL